MKEAYETELQNQTQIKAFANYFSIVVKKSA